MQTTLTLESVKVSPASKFLWEMMFNPLDALSNLARENGDIAHVRIRNRELFLLNHPQFIEQVLVRQQHNFVKGPALQRARILLGEGLLTGEGEEHLVQRRALQPAFHPNRIEEHVPVMAASTRSRLSSWKDGQRLNMAEEMMRLTLDIALWSFFGQSPEGAGERVGGAMQTLARLFPLILLPVPNEAGRLFPKFKQASDDLSTVAEALVANPGSEATRKALIQILKQNSEGRFSDEQARAHALTFLLAGHETTALLLAWAWDLLAHNEEAQRKLQAEADRLPGDRLPTAQDLEGLTYTRAVVKETLRLRPSAWAIGRQALEDCEIGGYYLPAGSVAIVSQWVTHHDPRFYADPNEFHPVRWDFIHEHSLPRFAFFPFGGGSRACIGEGFAWTEAVLVLVLIARRWRVRPVHAELATPQPTVTLRPKNGVTVILEKRKN